MTEHTDAEKAAEDHFAIVRDRNLGEGARYKVKWSGLYDGQEIREAFLAGAAWAAPKWISVKERLPEECCDVLAAIWDPYDRVHWYDVVGWGGPDVDKWLDYEMATHDHITHWMPLPAAPKEEK